MGARDRSGDDDSRGRGGRDTVLAAPRVRTAGVPLVARPAPEVIDGLRRCASGLRGPGIPVHFVNAYTVSLTSEARYLELFQSGGLNIADGTPLAWIARRRAPDVAHLRGPDAFRELLASDPRHGLRHFLLGGTEESLERLRLAVARDYPDTTVVGSFSPPFRPLGQADHDEIDVLIKDAGANVVWVGIGTPKQDYETVRLAKVHPAVVLAVGAAFNFVSGEVVEAPLLWRRTGLEWLYRLAREPRRLWGRYVFGNITFLFLVGRRRRG
ncbi:MULTISPECIES: WecB/TagA/CpsF family glycosyltransferase [unclassified Curtobacterium]|uniref:WecB/TagA/CpsF family glycosyltransferase n=1 Tax=unclassified Curtobacterium TaxID=257496 RepID=UPI001043E823|nr:MULTISPECIES: WecB/TagA/CpsF family glycosyltransferase [unclassified Curtobacterium]